MGQDAAAVKAFVKFDFAELRTVNAGDTVMPRQEVVDTCEVGVEELENAQVAAQYLAEKVNCL